MCGPGCVGGWGSVFTPRPVLMDRIVSIDSCHAHTCARAPDALLCEALGANFSFSESSICWVSHWWSTESVPSSARWWNTTVKYGHKFVTKHAGKFQHIAYSMTQVSSNFNPLVDPLSMIVSPEVQNILIQPNSRNLFVSCQHTHYVDASRFTVNW